MASSFDAPLDLDTAAYQWAAENAHVLAEAVQATIPRKTGQTAGTIQGEGVGNEIQVSGDKIAGYLQTGTVPHDISGHPWLVFEGDGGMVFWNTDVKGPIHHPGTGPDPYVENALDATIDQLSTALLDKIAAQW